MGVISIIMFMHIACHKSMFVSLNVSMASMEAVGIMLVSKHIWSEIITNTATNSFEVQFIQRVVTNMLGPH